MQGHAADEVDSHPQVVEMPVPWEALIPFGELTLNESLWLSLNIPD